jgi:fermentation-respiration switch protein FrsA (DUF1100 family)
MLTPRAAVVIALATVAAVGYLAATLVVYLRQDELVYRPSRRVEQDPSAVGLPFEAVTLATRDGERLGAWWIAPPAMRGAVVVSHGNGGNIDHRLHLARAFHDLGLATLLYDYRGYGASTGTPGERGTYLDAEAAYDHVAGARAVRAERIVAFGESLGGAVAIELARRRAVAAVVVEDTFSSLPDLAAEQYPWLPVRALARHRYDSLSKVAELGVPLLVIHSPEDELIAEAHGRRLYERARAPKRYLATGGRHNDGGFATRAGWVAEVGAFLDAALAGSR